MRLKKVGLCDTLSRGSEYTDDEVEFLKAMREYIRTSGRKFPTFTEVLAVARSLGYRRTGPVRPPLPPLGEV